MKAFLTSVGESTEQVCKEQLEKLGFEVVLLNDKEDWPTKYKRFIDLANEDCLRVDADTILFNDFEIPKLPEISMAQWLVADRKRFKINAGQPVYYSKKLLDIAKKVPVLNIRPETSMWRSPEIIKYTMTIDKVAGLHGFTNIKL